MLDKTLRFIEGYIPKNIYRTAQPYYHFVMAWSAALICGFPSRKIRVIAVTGTKGKSSTTEIINAILEEAGYKTALSNTIRFKIGSESWRNMHKMSMPGRFSMQSLIRRAVKEGCSHIVIEMTSQGALFHRHKFIDIDSFIFTNLSPEHIEAHGSYESYLDSKLAIAQSLAKSSKMTTIIANADDPETGKFLSCKADQKITYSLNEVRPYSIKSTGIDFTLDGRSIHSPLSGTFNLYNILAATTYARSVNISDKIIANAVGKFANIPGRVEEVSVGQNFHVVVDYAHTTDSLEKLYKVFRPEPLRNRSGERKLIAVLGGTGGGRDQWKRAKMGELADLYCDHIILTDEDPYDEDPQKIVADVASGIKFKTPTILMDRREAIAAALKLARSGDVILITGKGTDPYIMGPKGSKTLWSDALVAREELVKFMQR